MCVCMVYARYVRGICSLPFDFSRTYSTMTNLREAAEVAQCPRVARRRRDEEVKGGGGKVGLALLTGQRACHT